MKRLRIQQPFTCVLLLGAIHLSACSDDDETTADAGSNADGGVLADAAVGTDASTSDGSDPRTTGSVTLTQFVTAVGSPQQELYLVSAQFQRTTGPATACTVTTNGACTMSQCAAPQSTSTNVSAGNVTVSGGRLRAPIVLVPANNIYVTRTATGTAYEDEQELTLSVAGSSSVAAVSATLNAPSPVTLNEPTITSTGTTLARSQDVEFDWNVRSELPTGEVTVTISQSGTAGSSSSLVCKFEIEAPDATVPAALLGLFTAGDASLSVTAVNNNSEANSLISIAVQQVVTSAAITLQ